MEFELGGGLELHQESFQIRVPDFDGAVKAASGQVVRRRVGHTEDVV